MDDDFGVGLGLEQVVVAFQFRLEVLVVLDDAVMDDGDLAGRMGMGVGFGRTAMGRPAGVADADGSGKRLLLDAAVQVDQLAFRPAAIDPAIDQRRHAGTVVSAILQPPQTLDQKGSDLVLADDTDNTAHFMFA